MKHIIKLTILLITFTLVSCGEKAVQNKQSSQPEQPTFVARQPGTPKNPFALNRLAKQTVVEIVSESFLTGGDKYIPKGSGVIIGRKDSTYYVLTANHISEIDDGFSVFIRSEKPGERGEVQSVKFIKRYPREDLAVVAFASLTDYEVAEVGEASLLDDDNQVYVGGWPGNEDRPGFQFTPAKVTNPRAGDNLTYQPTQAGEDLYKGMSGGAVLNKAGQLVGIHVGLVEVGGDGEGVLISTFLREMPQEVDRVLVRATPVVLPSPTRENQTVINADNATPSQTQDAETGLTPDGNFIFTFLAILGLFRMLSLQANFYNNRGIVCYKRRKYEKALADYNHAIRLNPKYADAYYNRGLVYYDQGKHEKAFADYNQAIRLNPKYTSAYYNRGLTYKVNRNIEKAISDFEKAADLHKQQAAQKLYQNSLDQLQAAQKLYQNSLDQLKELRGN